MDDQSKKLLEDAILLKDMVDNHQGFKVLADALDEMIVSVIGGRRPDGRYVNGDQTGYSGKKYGLIEAMAYRDALIDFENYIYDFIESLEVFKRQEQEKANGMQEGS